MCAALISPLCSCQQKDEMHIDYLTAEKYEEALNEGENTIGKIVKFIPVELHPESPLGYNIWAGEHLNFISDFDPKATVGEPLVIKVETVKSLLSSWLITYNLIEGK